MDVSSNDDHVTTNDDSEVYHDPGPNQETVCPVPPVTDDPASAAMQVPFPMDLPSRYRVSSLSARPSVQGETSIRPQSRSRHYTSPSSFHVNPIAIDQDPRLHVSPTQATPEKPSNERENPNAVVNGIGLPVDPKNFHPVSFQERLDSRNTDRDEYLFDKLDTTHPSEATRRQPPDNNRNPPPASDEDAPNNSRRMSEHGSDSENN